MAYQYPMDEETVSAPRRRRTSASAATTRKRRRRKRNRVRFDLIFLAAVTLVVLLAIAMPRQQIQPDPTDDPVLENPTDPTDPPTDPPRSV